MEVTRQCSEDRKEWTALVYLTPGEQRDAVEVTGKMKSRHRYMR